MNKFFSSQAWLIIKSALIVAVLGAVSALITYFAGIDAWWGVAILAGLKAIQKYFAK